MECTNATAHETPHAEIWFAQSVAERQDRLRTVFSRQCLRSELNQGDRGQSYRLPYPRGLPAGRAPAPRAPLRRAQSLACRTGGQGRGLALGQPRPSPCATVDEQRLLADSPVPLGSRWIEHVNAAQTDGEVDALRRSINRGQAFGGEAWTAKVTRQLQLEHTYRPRGRPRKQPDE